jgi:hypothetical protein
MQDRRRQIRHRVIYGGVLAYNDRFSTMDCVVRNFTAWGAKIALPTNAILPDRLALTIRRKNREYAASIVWRSEREVGLEFIEPTDSRIIPLAKWRDRNRSHD